LTPNDGSDERTLTYQARPNVLVELGMALMADENKTIIVELERTRTISDTWGRNAVRYTDDTRFRDQLVTRLSDIGCEVKRTSSWLRAGNFKESIPEVELNTDATPVAAITPARPSDEEMRQGAKLGGESPPG
jgi:hypothetical protein